MKRRTFIKTAALAAAAVSLSDIANARGKEKLPSFGLITGNTGGDWVKNNPEKALEEIARLGYRYLEFGGDFGMGAVELKKFLKKNGLKPVIGPTSMKAMNDTALLKKDMAACKELGQKYIVCYWPWTDDGKNKKLDDWKRVAENLNKGGAVCRKNGLQLLYHNHDIEFKLTEGKLPFDTLMLNLDKNCVNLELDLYWITKGGQSPVEYIKKYPGRYPVFHVKDMNNVTDKDFACVGEGCIDFPAIFRLYKAAGTKHFIVEHDRPADPQQCVTAAARYLSGLRF